MSELTIARRICIHGVVQGVGFRPFVFHLAARHKVRGWVLNGAAGVEIHAEGTSHSLDALLADLRSNPPSAACIFAISVRPAELVGYEDFRIRPSQLEQAPTVRVAPDLRLCDDCLREMNDPQDRRHRYPYINCTNCGPRYSIIYRLPYDRSHTTMVDWEMCPACLSEYSDPLDRRYHAQPTACAACGPNYELDQDGQTRQVGHGAVRAAAELLRAGQIVAVKGIGGYHLACDATQAESVRELRLRKFRKEKPFAVMARSLQEARLVVELSPAHEACLTNAARPIVLAPAKTVLSGVAPDSRNLGVMLPYAPLHHLLFDCGAPHLLVLTSGNRSSEPIAYEDDEAFARLAGIADAFLIGQRRIARRVDDSVVTIRDDRAFILRRSRGYAPGRVASVPCTQPILAVGADLKNAIALSVDGEVFVSQHIGDLGDLEADQAFRETVRDLLEMYDIEQRDLTVAHDLHPQYTSTRFATTHPAGRHIAVQHHHAHVASVLAEFGLFDALAIGVALDGTGYGGDNTIWGFEIFQGSVRRGFERCAALRSVRVPGGDAAARFPVQAAAGFLAELDGLPSLTEAPFHFPARYTQALQLVEKNVRCFPATSAGRLFDTVAALLGFTREITFEGQAAMWLEHIAHQSSSAEPYGFGGFDYRILLRQIVDDRMAGCDIERIAYRFHAGLACELAEQIRRLCREFGTPYVAFSGGVFQNELLCELLQRELRSSASLQLLTNRAVPVNDGGVCLGQVALAAHQV